ncbi:MAG: hypothetical protein PHN80_01215 [Hespellia sp.]|nr:hypothetical protein [Hespellia sp.]
MSKKRSKRKIKGREQKSRYQGRGKLAVGMATSSVLENRMAVNDLTNQSTLGSVGLEHALEQNNGKARYDASGKKILSYKEVLATILKYSVSEYEAFPVEEIMNFIDVDSISNETPIAPDTDTRIRGDNPERSSVNEANLSFDVCFRVIRPSEKKIYVHVDVELQGNYYPGYPIEKRGIYNLSRMIDSQLDVINEATNYNKLEKAHCIFICVGNVPKYLWNTVSYYTFSNTKNVGEVETNPAAYDLMELAIIRIGEKISEDVTDIIHFLHGVFYAIDEVADYIDFSQNEEFRKELESMGLTGEHLIEYGRHQVEEETQKEIEKATKMAEVEKAARVKAEEEKSKVEEEKAKVEKEKAQLAEKVKELEALLKATK